MVDGLGTKRSVEVMMMTSKLAPPCNGGGEES